MREPSELDRALPPTRPLHFVGSSRKDLKQFPESVRRAMGRDLFTVQIGRTPSAAHELRGFTPKVWQIRDDSEGSTYRAAYVVALETGVYVLHCFEKKSTRGIATPQREIDLIRRRLQDAIDEDRLLKENER